MRRLLLSWIAVAAAAAAFLMPLDAAPIERWYSTRAYLAWQPTVTRFSNAVPFALFDVLLVTVLVTIAVILAVGVRGFRPGARLHALGVAARRLLTVGAVLYLWFLVMWGLNYRRVPLLDRIELSQGPPATAAVAALGRQTVEQLNALYAGAHAIGWADPWRDAGLRRAYQETQVALSETALASPGRLKPSLIGPYFRWASVDGMIDPFALELLANPDLLPLETPFVAAHEWAHLAGYANESEASFVGFVTCQGAGVPARYSAWLFLYWEVSGAVTAAERAALANALAAGPRADVAAVVERVRRGQLPRLRVISWAAYDQYLKANRIEEGVRSYSEVITLLARARFRDGWSPVRSSSAAAARRGGAAP